MIFCGSCGAQLDEGSRFCAKCGADQQAKTGGAAVAAAVAPPVVSVPQPVPPVAGMPPHYPPPGQNFPPPGQIPIVMGAPPVAPSKGKGWLWGAIIVAAVLYGLYYIGTHDKQNQGQTPTPQGQAPGPQAQPGAEPGAYPQQQPGGNPQQQPGYQQPGGQGQGGGNQALVQQQKFQGRWDGVNGYIQVSQAQWQNGSTVALQSATLECVQYAQSGQTITQMQTTLNGPAQPGQTITFGPFQMGQMAQGLAKVQCGIVGVNPAQ